MIDSDSPDDRTIITDDGLSLQPGDYAFNYYDMKPGTIQADLDDQGWFTFLHDDGTRALLNGDRICSINFAILKGWG